MRPHHGERRLEAQHAHGRGRPLAVLVLVRVRRVVAMREPWDIDSGLLTPTVGGPSVFPPQPDGVYKFTQINKNWQVSTGPDRYRRGLRVRRTLGEPPENPTPDIVQRRVGAHQRELELGDRAAEHREVDRAAVGGHDPGQAGRDPPAAQPLQSSRKPGLR